MFHLVPTQIQECKRQFRFALFFAPFLVGCSADSSPTEPLPVAPDRPAFAPSVEKALDGWSVVRFNGHTYIERREVFRNAYETEHEGSRGATNVSVSIVHDPDCTGKHRAGSETVSGGVR